ncbi:YadA-like family protein [Alcaligenes faecalis]|uniref:YadA-like family protein n=1 Tax=Alcaligenes faecalis TaxID=511 RepID=UPI00211C624B|nr:YadA-like family protein [Alcaligenes faecalis]UUO10252.1 YadA-like family protein [Alcaligenes faecalis]
MNHVYKTIWNEQTGTFVAVSEHKKAKGKRSSSCVKGGKRASFSARMGWLALLTASALAMSNAWAAVEIPGDGQNNLIDFTSPGGSIRFTGGGSIVGLSSLTISGALSADQITVGGESVATQAQLNVTSAEVQTNTGKIDGLEGRVTSNESTLTDHGTRITDNETAITGHDTRITDNETAITAHDTRISNNETVIADHGSRIGTAEAGLVTINDRLTALGVDDTNPGVKYFRANSEQPDAEANGEESIAIGPESKAEGDRSIAAGQGALADAQSAIALGDGASVASADSRPKPEAAIAIGKDSQSSGLASVAVGREAAASGNNALALGMQAQASGANGIALGLDAQADAENNISIGNGAGRATGNHLPGDRSHNIAIGQASGQNVKGQFNVALGDGTGNGVDGNENVALGRDAGQNIIGDSNVSLGKNANSGLSSNRAIGIGEDSGAETEGVAIGYKAIAGNTGVAVGRQTTALGTGTAIGPNAHADSNFVALGLNSYAAQNDVSGLGRFTNRGFDGSAVSVGSSQAGSEFTRRIVNVEDGANDTDAVNVRQLQSAVDQVTLGATVDYEKLAEKVGEDWGQQIADSKPRYFSVNDGGVDKGNKNNNGAAATAIDSIAIGPDATAKEKDSVAIGHMAGAEGASSVVMGHNIKGLGVNSTTIGNSQSEARDESGVAIGTHVVSRDKNSIVIGRDSYTDRQANGPSVENSIVIGTESSSTAVEGIVIGKNSVVNAARGIAQGSNATATANDAMAFGTRSRAAAGDSQASGTDAKAFAARGIAMGTNARSGQSNPDVENQDKNRDSIALGTDSIAQFNSSIAVGREAQATADYSLAQGKGAHAFGEASIAQGRDAWALERQAIALGDGSRSTADRAVAIGQGARAGNARSVALGDGAETAGAVGTSNASLNGLTYGNFAGDRPVATVSVGTDEEKRTLTNVAAGRISASSTDAINGSQLYATNSVLGNVANTTKKILGGNATLAPNGTLSMSNIGDTGENTVHDAIKYAAQGWHVSANGAATENVKPGGSVDFSNDDGNITVTRTGTDLAFNLADDLTIGNSITVGDTIVNGDSVTTTNLTVEGATRLGDNFEVNNAGDVIYKGSEVATQTDGLSFAGNTGGTIAKALGDDTPLTISGELAEGAESTGANLRVDSDGNKLNLVMAQNLTDINSITINNGGPVINGDGINMNGKKITDLAAGTDDTDAVNVSQLKDVEEVANAGWNISANGAAAENVKPGGSVDFSNDDGNITVTRTGTDLAFNLADDLTIGNSITVGDTIVNGDSVTTTNLTVEGATRLGDNFEVNNAGDVIYKGSEVATQTDGLSFAGNTGSTIAKTLGDNTPLTISGELAESEESTGANLRVDSDGNKLNLVMAQNLTDLNSITINNGGPVINGSGINMNGKKITNLEAGTDDTDAVNVSQLKDVEEVANAGWNISANGAAAENVKPGGSVDFSNDDGNITVTRTGTDLAFNLADDLTIGNSITVGDTIVNGDSVTTTNLTVEGATRLGDNFEVNNAGDVIYKGSEVATQTDGLSFAGNTGGTIAKALGDDTPLTISGELAEGAESTGANLRVDSDGNKLNLVMAQNLTDINSITINNGGPVINGDGINMNGKKITDLAAGTDDTDAVNVSQLKEVSDVANAGWNISANGGATENVKPGASVDFSNDDDNIVISRDGTDLAFNLADDLTVGNSITVGDTVINGDSVTVGDTVVNGDSITTNNLTVTGETRLGDNFVVNNDGDVIYKGGEIANLNDGLSFAGNTGSTIAKTLGDNTPLTISGELAEGAESTGMNLRVDSDGNKLNLVMAQNLTDLKSITINNGGPVINGDGINMSGKKITNLDAGTDDTDAVNVSQLKEVSDVANAGWNISANGAAAENVKPGASVDFSNDDGNITVTRTGTDLAFNLADDLTVGNSITVGDTVINGDSVTVGDTVVNGDSITTNNLTVTGETRLGDNFVVNNGGDVTYKGNEIATQADGLSFAGNTGSTIAKTLGDNTPLTISGELAEGAESTGENLRVDSDGNKLNLVMAKDLTDLNSITINNGGPVINGAGINMNGKKITNLAEGTDDTDAVNVSQLKEVSEVANAGWNISANGGATENVKPGASVDFSNTDGNINISRDGTDLAFNLNKDIDLGADGSLKTGNTVVNNDGLTVDDGAGNKTSTTAAGTTVSNAAGDTTTVGAGSITVADAAGNSTAIGSTQVVVGGANPVTINGDTGRIGGLTNLTWDPDNYTSGQAATEDQLKQVNDVASAGWNVTDADGNSANIGPNGQVAFVGDKNVTVEQTGTDDSGQVEVKLNKDIDLGADGSLKTGDTVINNAGVAVGNDVHLGNTGLTINNGPSITLAGINAGDMRITNVAAGRNPTDAVNYGQLQPIESFIGLDGNGSFAYNGGQHSSLKDVLDSMHWNVEAPTDGKEGGNTGGSNGNGSGSTGGGNNGSGDGTPIHNGNTVGFVEGDNIVISKTDRVNDAGQTVGADIKVSVSQDLKVNSITAVNVQADEIQINNGGPIINENGINMSGKHITNVAAGVNDTDAVNVSQLNQVAGNLQGQINNIRHDINRLDNRLSAGVAAAMATASLPQAYLPGKHMMSMAGGTWRGESGMAIGFSGITDNGKWVYKLSGNTTSRGDYGGAVGIGYQW